MGCSPRHPKTKIPSTGDFHCLCAGEDLNLHVLRHTHLKRACLPIPAPAQLAGRIIIVFIALSSKLIRVWQNDYKVTNEEDSRSQRVAFKPYGKTLAWQ